MYTFENYSLENIFWKNTLWKNLLLVYQRCAMVQRHRHPKVSVTDEQTNRIEARDTLYALLDASKDGKVDVEGCELRLRRLFWEVANWAKVEEPPKKRRGRK